MADSILTRSQLRLVLESGVDEIAGTSKKTLKTFNNVIPEATSSQLYAVGEAFASLQQYPLIMMERADNSELTKASDD